MGKQVPRRDGRREAGAAPDASVAATTGHPLRNWILGSVGMLAAAPVIGIVAGFLLLFGGVFLGVSWQVAAQPIVDAHRYATYTAAASGRIVESWAALDFDPARLPAQKLYWSRVSKISRCAVIEYNAGDFAAPLRRAFCGMQLRFDENFRLHDWTEMLQAGIPFTFLRDRSGFEVQELRLSKTALDWISTHPPHDTFGLAKPPPATALAALKRQFDWPIDVATLSWTTTVPAFPLRYDPAHPELALPAQLIIGGQHWNWLGVVVMAVFGFIGLMVWRLGMQMFFASEPSPLVIWVLTLLPLLALPWWGEALPQLLGHVNRNWAEIASDMMDDVTRGTRLLASAPDEATLVHGERLIWRLEQGDYADTFGRIRFAEPVPPPTSAAEVLTALSAQAAEQVARWEPEQRLALMQRLLQDKENGHDRDQQVFVAAAEAIARDANADPALHRATRQFLVFAAGYGEWDVDALEKSWKPAAQ